MQNCHFFQTFNCWQREQHISVILEPSSTCVLPCYLNVLTSYLNALNDKDELSLITNMRSTDIS